MKPQTITPKQGIKLLKEGNSLIAHLSGDMSTLSYSNEEYRWKGIHDKGPTSLEEESVQELISKNQWHINLP
jgi:hypothetical protein